MVANTQLAAPRRLLQRYIEEAALAANERARQLGLRIREARIDKRWKQKQLAAAVHVEPMTVSRWERGANTPDLDTLDLIARATGKPLSFFVAETAAETEPDLSDLREEVVELRERVDALLRHFGVDLPRAGSGRP